MTSPRTSSKVFMPLTPTHLPYDNQAGVDADPHSQLHTVRCCQTGIQGGDGLDHAQAGVHGTPGLVFMGCGVAKIDQQPVAEILRNIALKSLDDLGTGGLIGPDHRTQVFGVELAGQLGRADEITKQHGELAAFGLWGARRWRRRARLEVLADHSVGRLNGCSRS
jgi:hypothetical protein